MKRKKIIIGSRGSKLALIYAEKARQEILKFAKEFNIGEVEIKKITTAGDKNQKIRLSEIGGKGLFSKQIEDELLDDKIQIAIHALKDMPSQETNGLITNSFLKRNDAREVLISKDKIQIKELKPNGRLVLVSSIHYCTSTSSLSPRSLQGTFREILSWERLPA